MFENPNTIWIEVLVLVAAISFVTLILARYIYKKVHHIPTGDCACHHINVKKILKEYHKNKENL